MYLMSLSKTEPKVYHAVDIPQEALCDSSNYESAEEFFVNISGRIKTFTPLFDAAKVIDYHTRECKLALVAKAWMLFIAGEKLTKEGLVLTLSEDYKLIECPTVGGIDLGNPKDDHSGDEPSEAEKNGHKETEKAIQAEKKAASTKGFGSKPAPTKPTKKVGKKKIELGDTVYVSEDGGYWEGTLVEVYDAMGKPVAKVKGLNGKTHDTPVGNLSLEEPDI